MDKWRGLVRTPNDPEPLAVSVADAKLRLGFDASDTSNDTLISSLIRAAQSYVSNLLGIEFVNTTYTVTYDSVPYRSEAWWNGVREGAVNELYGQQNFIECPRSPLVSITSIIFYDQGNNPVTVDPAIYYVDTASDPGRAVLNFGQIWPPIVLRPAAGIEIEFVAGYGSDPVTLPGDLSEALLMMVAYLFEHRGECDLPMAYTRSGAKTLAASYHRRRPLL